ncbi:MAG: DNA methyltransferase, partial [Kiritimatiellae bacterium]|nr:DNA methyltransferase [Kiritimatiellia bacterium]
PPYSGHSENKGAWISDKIEDYKFVNGQPLNERNSKWLQDDYVKFIRFAQWRLDESGNGILAFISNNGYLDNPTFRGMRWSLMQSFNDIYILNLHGSSKKKETAPDGGKDENVFDIQQGVCIGIFIKQPDSSRKCQIHYADLWGERQNKYDTLDKLEVSKTKWQKANPREPFHVFIPQDKATADEYEQFLGIAEIAPLNVLGFQTHRDEIATAMLEQELENQIREFLTCIVKESDWEQYASVCSYRPFDSRYAYFHPKVCDRPRKELIANVLKKKNICLGIGRQGMAVNDPAWSLLTVARYPLDANVFRRGGVNVFPLYLYPDSNELNFGESARKPNLSDKFIKEFSGKLGLEFISDGQGDLKKTFGPEDVFYYIYAVLHSPTYRTRYADFLKIDFPRVPLTSDKKLFASLVKLGGELTALHLMEFEVGRAVPCAPQTAFPVAGDNIVARGFPKFKDGRVYISKTQYFDGVPSNVWNFTIGGYQVCKKWLKDRRERELSNDDLQHYKKIVAALSRTIELMREIDQAIPKWPME